MDLCIQWSSNEAIIENRLNCVEIRSHLKELWKNQANTNQIKKKKRQSSIKCGKYLKRTQKKQQQRSTRSAEIIGSKQKGRFCTATIPCQLGHKLAKFSHETINAMKQMSNHRMLDFSRYSKSRARKLYVCNQEHGSTRSKRNHQSSYILKSIQHLYEYQSVVSIISEPFSIKPHVALLYYHRT